VVVLGCSVLTYVENIGGKVNPASLELFSKARELASARGGKVYSVFVTALENSQELKELAAFGADVLLVYKVSESQLSNYLLHAEALTRAIRRVEPAVVLVSATPWGRSVAPRVAARLGLGLTADCLDVYMDEAGDIVQVRPAFTGNLIAHIKTVTSPVMATIRPGVFPRPQPNSSRSLEAVVVEELPAQSSGLEVLGPSKEKAVSLSDASVIVAVGRGLRKREDVSLFRELARMLGGEYAVSKPLVDTGWFEKERQVGFSGNIVKPKVYFAFGISGAPQHIAGMKDSECVVAVNTDPSAPIARYSDIFVVGDMYEVAQEILEKLKAFKS
jgi:electron transfer flavoprotein alpha subunit